MRTSLITGTLAAGLLLTSAVDACTQPVPTKPPRIRVLCLRPATATAPAVYRVYYTNYATFGSSRPTFCACALGVPPNNGVIQQIPSAVLNDNITGRPIGDSQGPLFPFQPNLNVGRAFAPRMPGLQLFGFFAPVARPVPGQICVTWCFDVVLTPQGSQARLEALLGQSQLGTTETNSTGTQLVGHTFVTKPGGRDPCCPIYYKFDRRSGRIAVNYGNCCAPAQGSLTNVGPAPGPWCPSFRPAGNGSLCGSSNTTSADQTWCDTGWNTGFGCSFTVAFYAKQRFNPGTGLSYCFGGMSLFRGFTNGVAGTGFWVRSWGGPDLMYPGNFQADARAANGVCIALVVDGVALRAQWYRNGAALGAAVAIPNGALVAPSSSTFKIGKHSSNTSTSAYDLDEFRLCNFPASPQQIRRWCAGPTAAWSAWGTPCGLWLDCQDGPPVPGNSRYNLCLFGPGAGPFALFLGFTPFGPLDLGIIDPNLRGCLFYTSPVIVLTGGTAANGIAKIPLPIPPGTAGARVDAQALGFSRAGLLASNTVTTKVENP